jgi:hypothetical protein
LKPFPHKPQTDEAGPAPPDGAIGIGDHGLNGDWRGEVCLARLPCIILALSIATPTLYTGHLLLKEKFSLSREALTEIPPFRQVAVDRHFRRGRSQITKSFY